MKTKRDSFRHLRSAGTYILCIVFLNVICFSHCLAQSQTVRGKVLDRDSHFPLPGAAVVLISDTTSLVGATADDQGEFRLLNIPVGRIALRISFMGYEDVLLGNLLVTSGKEVVLTVSLEESALSLDEVTVTAGRTGEASNEMAMVSARSFSIEETQRYAGSRGDPARMASNFAGVEGADDSRNDIVIRGNSPQSVLWRMEGINIPNPNHFNIPGTAGGPVSMINNQTLANSDFFTGAFPAEFGNSISGVFDLKLRNGNNEKHEHSGQFGFLGMEIFSEGPLSSKRSSSYLASYRYSTLDFFSKMGIEIGTTAVPRYQDMAFKFDFPLKGAGSVSVFALGGASKIDIMVSEQKRPERNIYGDNDRDQYFRSDGGLLGISFKQPVDANTFISATLAASRENVNAFHELVYRHLDNDQYVVDSMRPMLRYNFRQAKISASFLFSKKLRGRGVIESGFSMDTYFFDFRDSVRNIQEDSPDYGSWRIRWNSQDKGLLAQPYVQWKHQFATVDLAVGLHSQYFSVSQSWAPLEPRAGLTWKLNEKSSLTFGVGLHSQMQPAYLYFYGQSNDEEHNPIAHNKGMDFSRSLHLVTGYERFLGADIRLKGEFYYQHIFQVPVEKRTSSFSLLNTGAGFSRFYPDTLVNEGRGENYGVELTVEKSFSQGYLFLITGSLFESHYQGSDLVWRDTDYNGNYVVNMLLTKEWFVKNRNTISLGGKVTTSGGRRYGPVDIFASGKARDVVWVDATRNSLQFRPYFRTDVRINYRINRAKVSHEIALDLVNVFGTRNILKLTYAPTDADPSVSPVREEYQLGFLPLFYYRVDF